MRHLGRGRACHGGPMPWGIGLSSWLVMQEARRESGEGETASVHPGALRESVWWLYSCFATQLYLFHMSFTGQFYSLTCVFICVWWDATNRIESWSGFFFLSFIPWWWRIHKKVPDVYPSLFLFPNTVFVFSRVWLNYSLPTHWSSEFLKVSVVRPAQSLLNLEEAEEGNSVPAACASQYLLAPCSGWGWTSQPTLQSPLLRDEWGPNMQSHLQPDYSFFPTVVCQEERPVPALPSRT